MVEPPESGEQPAPEQPQRMDLPKWNRAKVKRVEAKSEDDAFQAGVRTAGRKAKQRSRMLLLSVLGLAAVVGGVVFFLNHRKEALATQSRILEQAVAYEARAQVGDPQQVFGERKREPPVPFVPDEAARQKLVGESIEELRSQAKSGPVVRLGEMIAGAEALERRDFAAATDIYRGLLEQLPDDHPLLFLVRENLGIAEEGAGQLEAALEQYAALAGEPGSFYRNQALAHQGRVLEALGRKDEALAAYRSYASEFGFEPAGPGAEFVRTRLQELDPAALAEAQRRKPEPSVIEAAPAEAAPPEVLP